MEMITIPREEYERLKIESEVDLELVEKIKRSLKDIKEGKINEWKED